MTYDEMHRIPTPCSLNGVLAGLRVAEQLLYESIPRGKLVSEVVSELVVVHGNLYAHCYVPEVKRRKTPAMTSSEHERMFSEGQAQGPSL